MIVFSSALTPDESRFPDWTKATHVLVQLENLDDGMVISYGKDGLIFNEFEFHRTGTSSDGKPLVYSVMKQHYSGIYFLT